MKFKGLCRFIHHYYGAIFVTYCHETESVTVTEVLNSRPTNSPCQSICKYSYYNQDVYRLPRDF